MIRPLDQSTNIIAQVFAARLTPRAMALARIIQAVKRGSDRRRFIRPRLLIHPLNARLVIARPTMQNEPPQHRGAKTPYNLERADVD
jgi:hypothetical protein